METPLDTPYSTPNGKLNGSAATENVIQGVPLVSASPKLATPATVAPS